MTGKGPSRPRVLHLAFEDHFRPGSGGGGLRTREVNRRLAERFDITVVTARYPGARGRVEDGVTYRHLGLSLGHLGSMATYHLAIPFYLLFKRPDLVVEDFAAPMSSALVPLWTGRPTAAVVQWLAASETSRRYRLPFWWFEQTGVRLHRHFVAVSEAIATQLRLLNPGADIHVAYGGVDLPDGTSPPACIPTDGESGTSTLLYLGRLEIEPKGLDVLVEVMVRLAGVPARLVIAGDGPHREALEALVEAQGIRDRVQFADRVEGAEKLRLLAGADVVVLPSRYESFGLAALEAAMAGSLVVAFRLPSFEEILPPGSAILVPPFDVDALTDAVRSALQAPRGPAARRDRVARATATRPRFSWAAAAEVHERVYRTAMAAPAGRRRAVRRFLGTGLRFRRFPLCRAPRPPDRPSTAVPLRSSVG